MRSFNNTNKLRVPHLRRLVKVYKDLDKRVVDSTRRAKHVAAIIQCDLEYLLETADELNFETDGEYTMLTSTQIIGIIEAIIRKVEDIERN